MTRRRPPAPATPSAPRLGLDELHIRGLGVIEDAVLPLGPGLTVVTGETGAGKTMVVTGLLLLFGGRADAARVRTGVEQASVEGRVHVVADGAAAARVRSAGGELDTESAFGSPYEPDHDPAAATVAEPAAAADSAAAGTAELLLRRVVSASGRSRAFVGGTSAPVAVLGELAEMLVAVHGQSDQLRLVRPAAQRAALDEFAGNDLAPYAAAFAEWRVAVEQLRERTERAAELRRETDLLSHGVAEIEAAAPQPGELTELTRLAVRLGHADALTTAARAAHDALSGDPDDPAPDATDVGQLLAGAGRSIATLQGEDAELDALAARLGELGALAADLGSDFGAYAAGLDADPARLEQIELRRAELNVLVRKYCDEPEPSLDAVLRWAVSARARLAEIDVSDEAIAVLRERLAAAETRAAGLAAALSKRRHAAATSLGRAVTSELAGLAMADAAVRVAVRLRPATSGPTLTVAGTSAGATADGVDEVELLLQPHPGAPELPIARGASGGELSRVMLALEVSLVGHSRGDAAVPTLVFDEVDAGVGGRAAVEVGRRLARLAKDRQVLVVTHLAQVAAFADRHVVVDKPAGDRATAVTAANAVKTPKAAKNPKAAKTAGSGGTGGRGGAATTAVTASDVRLVTDDERVAELARMLAGSDTPTAREHAAELLEDARS